MSTFKITQKHAENMTRARLRAIELRGLVRPDDINTRDYWTEINIKQNSPSGIKHDNITLFMAYDRCDSWHVSDNGVILMKDDGLVKMGHHRVASWIAREKLIHYGGFDEV